MTKKGFEAHGGYAVYFKRKKIKSNNYQRKRMHWTIDIIKETHDKPLVLTCERSSFPLRISSISFFSIHSRLKA